MATRIAQKSGNWSDPATWDGGVSLPSAGDVVQTGAYTVTIDQDITVGQLNPNSSGHFEVLAARAIVADVLMASTYATNGGVRCLHTAPDVVTITGNIVAGAVVGGHAVDNQATGTLTIIGNITGGTAGGAGNAGVHNTSTGTVNVTGNITGGTAGQSCHGLRNEVGGTVNIIGNVQGGTGAYSSALHNKGVGLCTVSGAAVGGSGTLAVGAYNLAGGTVDVIGNATGGTAVNNAYGIYNVAAGSVSCRLAIGGLVPGCSGIYGNSASGISTCKGMVCSSTGQPGIAGAVKLVIDPAVNIATFTRADTGAAHSLRTTPVRVSVAPRQLGG